MHSVDREFVNAECESSCQSPTKSDQDFALNNPRHFREEGANTYEKKITRPPFKKENLEIESTANKSTSPVAPPRKNRQNYLGAKYKSMTATDKIDQVPLQKDGSSKSENDLLSFTPGLSKENQNLPSYHDDKLKSVQSRKKALNSKIIMTEEQAQKHPTGIFRNKPVDEKFLSKNLSSISHHTDNEESIRSHPKCNRNGLGRIPLSKSTEELDHPHHLPLKQPHQQPHDTQTFHPNRKHLNLSPRNSFPIVNKPESRHEKEIRLALFANNTNPSTEGKSSKETPSKTHQDLPRQHLKLSPPPNVLLQQIGQPLAPTKSQPSSKRDTADGCRNSTTHEEIKISKELPESGRVESNYMRQTYPENKKALRNPINDDKKENFNSTVPVEIPQRPKHPPSYEEAIKLKQKQHEISLFAESLYKDSLREFNQISKTDKEHLKISPNHSKQPDQKCDKLYRKNVVNNASRQNLVQGHYQVSADKKWRKGTTLSNMASTSRLQRKISKSDSQLNFLCGDGSETKDRQKRYPITSSYSNEKNETHNCLNDGDRRCINIERAKEIRLEPGKRYRNATNQNCVMHEPLTKTKSVESTLNDKRTVDNNSKQSVLPWSVSDMINKFAPANDHRPLWVRHSSFK